jgi:hypothetical protein
MMDNDLKLDGNAAGGLLSEIFAIEMTTAEGTCRGCGRIKALGEFMLYRHEMGTVLRCAVCDTALIRIAHVGQCYWIDLGGISFLRITNNH